MANPTISKKQDISLTPNENAKLLFQTVYRDMQDEEMEESDIPKIKVSEFISKMAFYYEKIRNVVDYKEEHLLRKNAIERILKRQIVIEGSLSLKGVKSIDVSKHLITELIRAGYLPNNKIPEEKIGEIASVIDKYLDLRKEAIAANKDQSVQEKNNMANWILAIAASDIEEKMGRSEVDKMVVDYIYQILLSNVELPDDSSYMSDREIQIFLSIHRKYLRFDRDMQGYILFKYYNGHWDQATDEDVERVGRALPDLITAINKQIDHPLSKQLNKLASRYTVIFSILVDVISQDPAGVYNTIKKDPKAFPRLIKQACSKRYKNVRRKLWRAGVRSILYIFITKSFFAVLLEVPATKWFGQEVNIFSLAVNVTFPALLLFLIIFFTRKPSDDNTNRIVGGIEEVFFVEKERKDPLKLRRPVKRRKSLQFIFGLLYAITFFISFGAVVWALGKVHFNFISITIFLFFLAFVSFFSNRIRKSTKELTIIEGRDNLLGFLSDFFYVPIIMAGKWLSEKFSRINVFVFILDFIIEAPFKIFVDIAEEWTKYVKERKEDIA